MEYGEPQFFPGNCVRYLETILEETDEEYDDEDILRVREDEEEEANSSGRHWWTGDSDTDTDSVIRVENNNVNKGPIIIPRTTVGSISKTVADLSAPPPIEDDSDSLIIAASHPNASAFQSPFRSSASSQPFELEDLHLLDQLDLAFEETLMEPRRRSGFALANLQHYRNSHTDDNHPISSNVAGSKSHFESVKESLLASVKTMSIMHKKIMQTSSSESSDSSEAPAEVAEEDFFCSYSSSSCSEGDEEPDPGTVSTAEESSSSDSEKNPGVVLAEFSLESSNDNNLLQVNSESNKKVEVQSTRKMNGNLSTSADRIRSFRSFDSLNSLGGSELLFAPFSHPMKIELESPPEENRKDVVISPHDSEQGNKNCATSSSSSGSSKGIAMSTENLSEDSGIGTEGSGSPSHHVLLLKDNCPNIEDLKTEFVINPMLFSSISSTSSSSDGPSSFNNGSGSYMAVIQEILPQQEEQEDARRPTENVSHESNIETTTTTNTTSAHTTECTEGEPIEIGGKLAHTTTNACAVGSKESVCSEKWFEPDTVCAQGELFNCSSVADPVENSSLSDDDMSDRAFAKILQELSNEDEDYITYTTSTTTTNIQEVAMAEQDSGNYEVIGAPVSACSSDSEEIIKKGSYGPQQTEIVLIKRNSRTPSPSIAINRGSTGDPVLSPNSVAAKSRVHFSPVVSEISWRESYIDPAEEDEPTMSRESVQDVPPPTQGNAPVLVEKIQMTSTALHGSEYEEGPGFMEEKAILESEEVNHYPGPSKLSMVPDLLTQCEAQDNMGPQKTQEVALPPPKVLREHHQQQILPQIFADKGSNKNTSKSKLPPPHPPPPIPVSNNKGSKENNQEGGKKMGFFQRLSKIRLSGGKSNKNTKQKIHPKDGGNILNTSSSSSNSGGTGSVKYVDNGFNNGPSSPQQQQQSMGNHERVINNQLPPPPAMLDSSTEEENAFENILDEIAGIKNIRLRQEMKASRDCEPSERPQLRSFAQRKQFYSVGGTAEETVDEHHGNNETLVHLDQKLSQFGEEAMNRSRDQMKGVQIEPEMFLNASANKNIVATNSNDSRKKRNSSGDEKNTTNEREWYKLLKTATDKYHHYIGGGNKHKGSSSSSTGIVETDLDTGE